MKDFSFWKEYDGASEGSGRSEKIWLQNPDTGQIGLFKFKKDIDTTDNISEKNIPNYMGKDKNRWNSLIDTKSKSLIRCREIDEKRPTHLEVLKYLKENYYNDTYVFAKNIVSLLTEEKIYSILDLYSEDGLSEKKKILILKFLLDKIKMMNYIYFGEEE